MLAKSLSSIVLQPITGVDCIIKGLAMDSRLVKNDYLFFAVKGEHLDGHEFIDKAIENGATAIALENEEYIKNDHISYVKCDQLKSEIGNIAARFYGNPAQDMCVIGVTGTNGKTSISHYIAQLFDLLGQSCGVIGTLGIEYQGNKIQTNNTTPDAIFLQKSFYGMMQANVKNVAMEVSSHALTQSRCTSIRFDTAIMSNVTHDHLDYHGDFDAYMNAKLTLFTYQGLRLAIINKDDASADKIRKVVDASVHIITYSLADMTADVFLSNIAINSNGYSAILNYAGQKFPFTVGLLGEFNLCNLLAAIMALCGQGYAVQDVIGVIEKLKPVAGRMQLVPNKYNVIAVVDYAHTPDALENVLRSLRKQVRGKIIVVFGCGGDRDKEKRPKMGRIAEDLSDYAIITADNPRCEQLDNILEDIKGGMIGGRYQLIPDRQSAIVLAVSLAAPEDCVLVAGKGHEKTQITGSTIRPFDDVEVLAEAFASKSEAIC